MHLMGTCHPCVAFALRQGRVGRGVGEGEGLGCDIWEGFRFEEFWQAGHPSIRRTYSHKDAELNRNP